MPIGPVLLTDGGALQLHPAACSTDVAAFEAALHAAARASSSAERMQSLSAAIERYQGELLPGCFEAWVVPERLRLVEAFLQAVHQLLVELELVGDLPGALQLAWRAVAIDPQRDETHADLIRLLAATGQLETVLQRQKKPGGSSGLPGEERHGEDDPPAFRRSAPASWPSSCELSGGLPVEKLE